VETIMTANPPPAGTLGHSSPPPPPPQRQDPSRNPGLSPLAKVLLFVGLPLLIILIGTGLTLLFWLTPVTFSHTDASSPTIAVTAPNAGIRVRPSTDDKVHVKATGWYSGPKPTLTVDTNGDTTTIQGRCSGAWFSRCSLEITISAPATVDLTVASTNGAIGVSDLTGSVRVETTNGRIDTRNLIGTLDLRTTNGAIRVAGCESDDVVAQTTNGAVDLHFTQAPSTVEARSTNGSITVRVPDDVTYFVEAHTVNGRVDTNDIGSDRKAERTITAETINGGVTVKPESTHK
jgi:DUF4097 and DUF4098 domain-containing protein YvlB